MALQAIRRVKARHPGLEVDYLVGEECRDLALGNPLLRKVFVIPKRDLKALWEGGDSEGVLARLGAFLAEMAATRYALSANLFQERWGGLLQGMVNSDRKIGLELAEASRFQVRSRWLEHLFAIPAHRAGNCLHVVDIYARAISQALGGGSESSLRRAENAASLLPMLLRPNACKNLAPETYLAFHPGSAWAGKRWPEAHWAGLADRCAAAGFTLAFTGAPEDRPMMDRIAASLAPRTRAALVDCVGRTSLPGAAWVYAHARMLISGDTVAMHLAAAAGIRTLSLFGASNPVETGPYGKGHVIIQTDANPLPDLAFDSEHAGLRHLRAEEVAAYVLDGEPPPGFRMWETGWDESRKAQGLFDAQRLPYPHPAIALALARVLDAQEALPGSPVPVDRPDGLRGRLRTCLDKCIGQPLDENLAVLTAIEKELEEETRADLIWEAYRIAVNGLPWGDLRAHLILRKARLESALEEEALTRHADPIA